MIQYEQHKFYCLNCGREGIPIPRKIGHQYKQFHRKRLYCPWCKNEVNHIEIKNTEQEQQFKLDFTKGVYVDEAKQSMDFVRAARMW